MLQTLLLSISFRPVYLQSGLTICTPFLAVIPRASSAFHSQFAYVDCRCRSFGLPVASCQLPAIWLQMWPAAADLRCWPDLWPNYVVICAIFGKRLLRRSLSHCRFIVHDKFRALRALLRLSVKEYVNCLANGCQWSRGSKILLKCCKRCSRDG